MFEDLEKSSIESCTIFKVTAGLRDSNPYAYTPKMISIGPYHKENPQLRPMEKYKLVYLRRFLQLKKGLDVESCMSELEKLKKEAIKCYSDIEDHETDHSTSHFLEMLLLDGCFVVEFIRECYGKHPKRKYIIKVDCMRNEIFRDLLLLENQLPFFVLNKLHHMTKHDKELPFAIMVKSSFHRNLLKMPPVAAARLESYDNPNARDIKHLLHLIHKSWHVNRNTDPKYSRKSSCCNPFRIFTLKGKLKDTYYKVMPNATELSEAGISFIRFGNIFGKLNKAYIGDISLFDIKFENGLMKIPCLEVFDSTESNLRNFIAFEQQSGVHRKYFSNFAAIMDQLIDSDKDVSFLRQKGIIVNAIGEDKEVARVFNSIGKGVSHSQAFFDKEEYKNVIQYCEKPWNKIMANLMHNYFSSPWVGASTVAAIILLVLTAMQTVLAFTGSVK